MARFDSAGENGYFRNIDFDASLQIHDMRTDGIGGMCIVGLFRDTKQRGFLARFNHNSGTFISAQRLLGSGNGGYVAAVTTHRLRL